MACSKKCSLNPSKMLKGYKTYIVAALMVAVAIVNMWSGDIYMVDLLADPNLLVLLNGLGFAGLRAAK